MENYETLGVLGEGTYGVVIKARHCKTGQLVAIKKFKQAEDDDHVRKTSLREVKVLKQLRHPNVISLTDVFRRDGKLYLVFEYIENTILQLLEATTHGLKPLEVKKFMYQLLRGVDYCHGHSVIHRDVKPENILVSREGLLKVCDFGFARHMTNKGKYTDYVATRWYRSPELLVGDVAYGKGVDVWAIGCIFAELSDSQPLFPGDSDLDQLAMILRTCGPVPEHMVKTFERNPLYRRVPFPHPSRGVHRSLAERYPCQSPEWMEFLCACLRTDPEQRPTCAELMNFPYFTNGNFRVEYERELQRMAMAATPWLYASNSSPVGSPLHVMPSPAPAESPKAAAALVKTMKQKSSTSMTSGAAPLNIVPDNIGSSSDNQNALAAESSGGVAKAAVGNANSSNNAAGEEEGAVLVLPDLPANLRTSPPPQQQQQQHSEPTNTCSSHNGTMAKKDLMSMSGKSCFNASFGNQRGGASESTSSSNIPVIHASTTGSTALPHPLQGTAGDPFPHLGVLWSQYLGGNISANPATTASNAALPISLLPSIHTTQHAAAHGIASGATATPGALAPPTSPPPPTTTSSSLFATSHGKHKPHYATPTTVSTTATNTTTTAAPAVSQTVLGSSRTDSRRPSLSVAGVPAVGGLARSPRRQSKTKNTDSSARAGGMSPTKTAGGVAAEGGAKAAPMGPTTPKLGAVAHHCKDEAKDGDAYQLTVGSCSPLGTPTSHDRNGITSVSAPSTPRSTPGHERSVSRHNAAPPDREEEEVGPSPPPCPEAPARKAKRVSLVRASRSESAMRAAAALQALSAFRHSAVGEGQRFSEHDAGVAAALPLLSGVGGGAADKGPSRGSPSPPSQSAASPASSRRMVLKQRKVLNRVGPAGAGAGHKPAGVRLKKKKREDESVDSAASPADGAHGRVTNPLQLRQPALRQSTNKSSSRGAKEDQWGGGGTTHATAAPTDEANANPRANRGSNADVGSYGGYQSYFKQQYPHSVLASHKLAKRTAPSPVAGPSSSTGVSEAPIPTPTITTANAGYSYVKNTRSMKRGGVNAGGEHGGTGDVCVTASGAGATASSRLEELLASKGGARGPGGLPQLSVARD